MTGDGMARRPEGWIAALLLAWAMLSCPTASMADDCATDAPLHKALHPFYHSLDALKAGTRDEVRILQLGDSHITLDHLTGAMRQKWAAQFGDAGRGLPAGVPYLYYAPQGFEVAMEGTWDVASSFRASTPGPFGIQGFRLTSNNPASRMLLKRVDGETIASVTLEVAGGPDTGALLLTLGGAGPLKLETRQAREGLLRLRVPAADVREMSLRPYGNGPVRVLGWAVATGKPGIRFDSYGIVGAASRVMGNWTPHIMRDQIRALAPALVIYAYGTNEGFDDGLDLDAEKKRFLTFVARIKDAAPDASIVVMGAFDGARQARGAGAACNADWETPPKLIALREMMRALADETGVAFWDGEAAMGGRCSIDRWARAEPPLAWPDRVHLRPEGSRQMGEAFRAAMMAGYGAGECAVGGKP